MANNAASSHFPRHTLDLQDGSPAPESALRRAIAPGFKAVRSQAGPLVVIQIAAVILVVTYYRSPNFQTTAAQLAAWKVAGGILFSFAGGAVAGGVIPEIAKLLMGRIKRFDRAWLASAGYNAFVYGVVGVEVDLFYRLQASWFGADNDPKTLVVKTLVDMALFSPLLCIPTATLLYVWKRREFRFRGWRAVFTRWFYAKEIWPTLIPCWMFWIPVLLCVYAMPVNLQFCFALLAEAAWSMVFVVMVHRE